MFCQSVLEKNHYISFWNKDVGLKSIFYVKTIVTLMTG